MEKRFLLTGLILGVLAIILGAFGAHALKNYFTSEQLNSFETGIRYQMYHALLMIIICRKSLLTTTALYWLLVLGTILFSLSIYLLNLGAAFGIEYVSILGPITPIGGTLLIVAWIYMILKAIKS